MQKNLDVVQVYSALGWVKKLGYDDKTFLASNGWLEAFKKRHALIGKVISDEERGVSTEDVEDFRASLPVRLKGLEARNVYNCDETGLFFNAVGTRGLGVKGISSHGQRQPKDRITLLICGNALGKMRKVLRVGKDSQPLVLKGKIGKFPTEYTSSKKRFYDNFGIQAIAFMFTQMRKEKRHVQL